MNASELILSIPVRLSTTVDPTSSVDCKNTVNTVVGAIQPQHRMAMRSASNYERCCLGYHVTNTTCTRNDK